MADDRSMMLTYQGEVAPVQAYLARPETDSPRPAVIIIHEIFGLVDHTKDVAHRFAREGYVAFAPHLFSRPSLAELLIPSNIGAVMQFASTLPRDRMADPAFMQEALAKLPPEKRDIVQAVMPVMFGGMPKDSLTQDLVRALDYLNAQSFVQKGKVASVGFCFGGGMSINFACQARLAASVVFYGENPNPIERVEAIAGPVLGLYGADDARINMHLDELVRAMTKYRKDFEMKVYPGAAHAFFNDTSPTTYRAAPAREAWERVLQFYRRTLLES